MNSKLIVIEGVDGTGKHTQSQLLIDYLTRTFGVAHLFGFPDYAGTQSGQTIGRMLSGELGDIGKVHPYFTASLFALDRAEKRTQIQKHLDRGEWVVCDRYVYSNVAHQACRLPPSQRAGFLTWVEHIEFKVLEMPKPEITILLSMDDIHSKALREQRPEHSYSGSVLDLHETDLTSMSNARQIYDELGRMLSWNVIDCTLNGKLRSINEISDDVISIVKKYTGA